MCDYLSLFDDSARYLEQLHEAAEKAQEAKELEVRTARRIQSVFRGFCVRVWIYGLNVQALQIQRCFRGHMGRKWINRLKAQRVRERKFSRFVYFAIQIQRSFRGFYSRKYRRNNAKRRQFIRDLEEKSIAVREMQAQYAQEQEEREALEREQAALDSQRKFASNLHHLVSTSHMPGIYNPNPAFKDVPTLNDIPVESHIRAVVRDLLRTKGIHKTGLVEDLHGSKKIPYKGMANRLSLQACAPYDAVEKEKLRTLRLHRIITKGKGSFFAGGKTKLIDHNIAPISAGDPYVDPWANPLMVRGVPNSEKQLRESAHIRKPLFVPHLERPFYTLSGGNKSSVLPNQLFDVILEAEESGGPAQRHLGHTKRFGVPDTCDNRPATELDRKEGETLPAPPPRASAIVKGRPR